MKGAALLRIYRSLTSAFAPLAPLFLFWRQIRGLEDRARLKERLGISRLTPLPKPVAWLHGASLGESLALLPLLEKLASQGFHILLTTGTVTSAAVMARRLPAGALHQYLPLDTGRFMARFLDHWQPDIAIIAESEIWPNLYLETERRSIPLVLVNARLSERSFRRWQHLRGFIAALLQKTTLCLAQSASDAERFIQLGAPNVHVGGNLKFDVAPPPADSQALAELKARIGQRPVWVAAAIHLGEEDIVFRAHRALLPAFPDLLTVVVPRHPRDAPHIKTSAERLDLPCLLRSQDVRGEPLAGIYIADSVGEMGLFYRVSEIAFIGKSLGHSMRQSSGVGGGQSPIEAVKLGCAILHGPDVGNFREIYTHLDALQGAALIADAESLAKALALLFTDEAGCRRMARIASDLVERLGGVSDYIMQTLEPQIAGIMGIGRPQS
jgi:3-deoxy-D-manno-octulosonic-acid transferase